MSIVEKIREKPAVGAGLAGGLVAIAAVILVYSNWSVKQAKFDQAYFTVDDGKTWYSDSIYLVPPVQHENQEAVLAQIYSYSSGSKRFCAYLSKFTPSGKQKLEAQLNATIGAHKPPGTTPLLGDRVFVNANTLIKKPGDAEWVPYNDPRANKILAPVAPDGSEVDQVFVY